MENEQVLVSNAEMWLLAAGGLVGLAAIAAVSTRNAWGRLGRMLPMPPNRLEPLDLAAGIIALLILPVFVLQVAMLIAPTEQGVPSMESATTQASQPSDAAQVAGILSPWRVAGTALGQVTATALMLLIGAMRFEGGLGGWGLHLRGLWKRTLQALAAFVGTWPLCFGMLLVTMLGLRYFVPDYAPEEHITIRILRSGEMPGWALAATAVGAIVFAPICEECLFRGILLPLVEKLTRSAWLAIAVSGGLFGLIHYSLPHTIPALTVFGFVLGYAYVKTRSLTLVILLHAVFNAKTLLWLSLGY